MPSLAQVSTEKLLKEFSKALESGDAALFIGAGLSKPAGFVDWKNLMREIAQDLDLNIDRETDLIAVAQYHVNKMGGRGELNRLLIEEFTKDAVVTHNHRLITSLPLRTAWTTNYDKLIETAYRESHKRPDVKTTKENLAQTLPQRDVIVYKMHGDVSQPQDAVLTKDDYETYADRRELFSTVLRGDLVSKTFLFLGFSFTDPNIDYILARIRALLGQNQRTHYCIMRWPQKPVGTGAALAEYEYERRKLELRIADLSRYGIHAVMIDHYGQITEILQQLNRRSHSHHIFVSGSAYDYAPLGRDRLEKFARALGTEIVRRGNTLVSGFGFGIGGAVVLGALESVYAADLSPNRVMLFPFPQQAPETMTQEEFRRNFRTNMIANAGFAVFISGNRFDAARQEVVPGQGVIQEFEIALDLGRVPIPIGATGHAAKEIWEQVRKDPGRYYGKTDVNDALGILGDTESTDQQIIAAVFGIVDRLQSH